MLLGISGAVLLGVSLLFTSGVDPTADADGLQEKVPSEQTPLDYAGGLEQKLAGIVAHMSGVETEPENVRVMITLEGTFESVYAYNAEVSDGDLSSGVTTSEKQIVLADVASGNATGKGPILVKQVNPRVKGVVIVCPGGGDKGTRQDIVDAASALFGIPSVRIEVYESGGASQVTAAEQ